MMNDRRTRIIRLASMVKEAAYEYTTLVVDSNLNEFKEAYDEIMKRMKYLIKDTLVARRRLEIENMGLRVFAYKDYESSAYDITYNTVNLTIPEFIFKKKGIIDENSEVIGDEETVKRKVFDIIYNDPKIYSVLIHEVMHGLQREGDIKDELRGKRKLLELGLGGGSSYVDLMDEQASNLESIYSLKKKGITKEQYEKASYNEIIRRCFDMSGVDPNNVTINDFDKMRGLINKYWKDYNIDPNISFDEMKKMFFGFIQRLAKHHLKNNRLFKYIIDHWDEAKLERKEVPKGVWGSSRERIIRLAEEINEVKEIKEEDEEWKKIKSLAQKRVDESEPVGRMSEVIQPREDYVYRIITMQDYDNALSSGELRPGRSADHGDTVNFSKEPIPIYGGAAYGSHGVVLEVPESAIDDYDYYHGSKDLYIASKKPVPMSDVSRAWAIQFGGKDGMKVVEITYLLKG